MPNTNKGKSINLFLMDGDASGRVKCTLANWTGIAYKIPRVSLDLCKDRPDLQQSAVYFLFGTSDETGEDVVYVGQAGIRKNGEGLLGRLLEHHRNPEKDYWTEAVAFTTSNNSFGPTEISYLENRFTALAKEANRYMVKNGNEPTLGNVTEEKECELEEFIETARLIMGTLGHKIFVPKVPRKRVLVSHRHEAEEENDMLFCMGPEAKATGQITPDGLVVLAGSKIRPFLVDSSPLYVKKKREELANKYDENFILKEDLLFSSPSAAAAFVLGRSANGLISWKNKEGKTLKDLNKES